jgi:hypothetical protein
MLSESDEAEEGADMPNASFDSDSSELSPPRADEWEEDENADAADAASSSDSEDSSDSDESDDEAANIMAAVEAFQERERIDRDRAKRGLRVRKQRDVLGL